MFTGIIKKIGEVKKIQKRQGSLLFTIKRPAAWKLKLGNSIAIDGACLTIVRVTPESCQVELMPETLKITKFGKAVPSRVNLEQPLQFGGSLDGHLVQGHVDSFGKIKKIVKKNRAKFLTISFPKKFSKLVVKKGSLAVDGVSLTVIAFGLGWLTVSLVNFTLKNTTLGNKQPGDLVNLEFDIIAKYLNR